MTLIAIAAAWLAGIAVAHAHAAAWWLWLAGGALAAAGAILTRGRDRWPLILGCVATLFLGAARYTLSARPPGDDDLAAYNDAGYVTLTGWIAEQPDVRDTHVNLRVRVEQITPADGVPIAIHGDALIQAPLPTDYRYGAPVEGYGRLEPPPQRDYLARQGIHSLMRYARVEVTGPRRGSPIRAAMLDFRQAAYQTIIRLLPDPQAALLSGILLGIESRISPDVRAAFNAVGATHVIAISGSNMVILAGLIQALAGRAFRRPGWVAGLTIAGVLAYAVFVGGDAAVIRAAVMTTLALVAAELGRQTYGLASLGFTALLMTLIDPDLLWDASFQLSFLATLGLILYVDPLHDTLQRALERITSKERARAIVGAVSDAFVVTVAAQITTTPLMALTFGRFSLLSLPVNFLIIPAQPPLMVLGGIAVVLGMVALPLGQIVAWGAWLFLSWTIGVVRFAAALPGASLPVEGISPAAIWTIYGVLFAVTAFAMQHPDARARQLGRLREALGVKALAAAGLGVAALTFAAAGSLPDGRLHVTFVDVGAGQATLIVTPSGRQVLVDAGGSGRQLATALGDALPFWDRQLDLLILTDPGQADALPTLAGRYRFDAVIAGGASPSAADADALAALNDVPQPVTAQAGETVHVGDGVTLMALSAPPSAWMLTYGEVQMFLPGDLSAESAGALLISGQPLQAAVMLVPGGGHREVATEALLTAVSPAVAVMSVSEGNSAGLPHAEVLERLAALGTAIYRTDRDGDIEIISDGTQLWVKNGR
jgi:competence protein ComEC